MTRLLPYPLLAVCLFGMWMVLANSVTPWQIFLGIVAAVGATWAMRALQPDKPKLRRPWAAVRLFFLVSVDIIRSNFAVATIIIQREITRRRAPSSNFMSIHLDLHNPNGLAVLACILTSTPGTVWVNYDRGSGELLIHVLDLIDEETWIQIIKGRYERLLLEIFE